MTQMIETFKLIYFKSDTGKYYTSARYQTKSDVWDGRQEIKELMRKGELPGLTPSKEQDCHVFVEDDYGCLLLITRDML